MERLAHVVAIDRTFATCEKPRNLDVLFAVLYDMVTCKENLICAGNVDSRLVSERLSFVFGNNAKGRMNAENFRESRIHEHKASIFPKHRFYCCEYEVARSLCRKLLKLILHVDVRRRCHDCFVNPQEDENNVVKTVGLD